LLLGVQDYPRSESIGAICLGVKVSWDAMPVCLKRRRGAFGMSAEEPSPAGAGRMQVGIMSPKVTGAGIAWHRIVSTQTQAAREERRAKNPMQHATAMRLRM